MQNAKYKAVNALKIRESRKRALQKAQNKKVSPFSKKCPKKCPSSPFLAHATPMFYLCIVKKARTKEPR